MSKITDYSAFNKSFTQVLKKKNNYNFTESLQQCPQKRIFNDYLRNALN